MPQRLQVGRSLQCQRARHPLGPDPGQSLPNLQVFHLNHHLWVIFISSELSVEVQQVKSAAAPLMVCHACSRGKSSQLGSLPEVVARGGAERKTFWLHPDETAQSHTAETAHPKKHCHAAPHHARMHAGKRSSRSSMRSFQS